MKELYTPERKKVFQRRAAAALILAAVLITAALAVSVFLCRDVRMGNARPRLYLCTGLCALAGAAALALSEYVILPCRRLVRHMDRILRESGEESEGPVLAVGEAVRIPRSISFAQVTVAGPEGDTRRWKLALALSAPPEAGQALRFGTRGGYITAMEGKTAKKAPRGGGHPVRRALSLGTRAVLCFLCCAVLWGFVFSHLTDAPAGEKITLFIHSVRVESEALSAALEERLPPGIRMVQARAFSYAMMDSAGLENADLYVVSAGDAETYKDWFAPIPEEWRDREGCLALEGVPMGIPVRDAGRPYMEYLSPEGNGGEFYLFFGKHSLHAPASGDGAALITAEAFLDPLHSGG